MFFRVACDVFRDACDVSSLYMRYVFVFSCDMFYVAFEIKAMCFFVRFLFYLNYSAVVIRLLEHLDRDSVL